MAIECSICLVSSSGTDSSPFSSIPCGHVFHFSCIAQWLRNAKKCPECRKPCASERMIIRLYLQTGNLSAPDTTISDANALQQYANQWAEKCQAKTQECEQKQRELDELQETAVKAQERVSSLEIACCKLEESLAGSKERLKYFAKYKRDLENCQAEMETLRKETKTWREEAEKLQRVKCVVTGDVVDVKQMLMDVQSVRDSTAVRESLVICVEALKNEMEKLKETNKQMRVDTEKWRNSRRRFMDLLDQSRTKISLLEGEVGERDEKVRRLKEKLLKLGKMLESGKSMRKTQIKQFIYESPAPNGIFLECGRGNSALWQENHDSNQHPLQTDGDALAGNNPKKVRNNGVYNPDFFLPTSPGVEDSPLSTGKKCVVSRKADSRQQKLGKSVFGECAAPSPFTPSEKDPPPLWQKSNPFRKIPKKESRNAFASKFDADDVVVLED